MRRFGIVAAAALVAVTARVATAQEVPTVGVMDLGAFAVSLQDVSALGPVMANMITTELSERPEVRPVDRMVIQELLERHQVSIGATGASDEAAVRIGRLIGAHYMVLGGVVIEPRGARVDLRMVEVETGSVVRSIKENGSQEEMVALAERIADRLVTDLELPERPATLVVDIPVAASLAYSRGLDYERRGRRDRAQAMFLRALEVYPQHPHAQAALDRVN